VQAVTGAQVVAAARRYVDSSRATTLIVGDYRAIETSLGSLGIGRPQLLSADE
jgi:hypothetical protein